MSFQAAPQSIELLHEHSGSARDQAIAHHAAQVALLELTMIGFSLSGWERVATPAELRPGAWRWQP